jgi:OOP family OmpA-OmpF porin
LAADAALRSGSLQVGVDGHADPAEPAERAQALSVQRAEAVAAELRRVGLPVARLRVAGFGASHPMVNEVNEPQNRRVEIVIRPSERPARQR